MTKSPQLRLSPETANVQTVDGATDGLGACANANAALSASNRAGWAMKCRLIRCMLSSIDRQSRCRVDESEFSTGGDQCRAFRKRQIILASFYLTLPAMLRA